jgi:uncharacterized protein YxjI
MSEPAEGVAETLERDLIGGIDLSGDRYVIKQSYIRSKYRVEDGAGETVLKGSKKHFKIKEEFPFTAPDGSVVFRLKAQNVFDVAGDYALVDEASGDAFAVVEKEWTMFKHVYHIRSPEGQRWATIESESAFVMAAKEMVEVLGLLPHSYSITAPDGTRLGIIKEEFTLRDVYRVTLDETGDAPREAILAAAVAIDALEEN